MMEKNTELIILYDYYGSLLSEQHRWCFEAYYFNDLSLAEISDLLKVSRNAIHKQLKLIAEKLFEYETKLQLVVKHKQIKALLDEKTFAQIEEYI